MERLFQISAVILIGIAAYFLWRGNNDAMFVAAVGGAVCFFLSVRFQVKDRLETRQAEKREENFNAETSERSGDFKKDSADDRTSEN